jgi:serine/threonine protein kinase
VDARIRLGQRIGRGGMAEVFAARLVGPSGFEKDVAVKRLLPRFSSDPTFLERFLNEARLAARLSHPNIVQIFELGHDGHDHYIVMEAVRGCSLRMLLGRLAEVHGKVPAPIAAYIGASLCAGLAHAHDQHRVIHRDVSPHNVLLSFDGAVKLIDFGIARARSDERLTQVGQVIGKRRYMSPEQMAGEALDGRSDLFPAGIMLYEMIAGVHPFDEAREASKADEALVSDRIRSGDRLPLIEVEPSLDKALVGIVERSLEIHRDRRFATARDMARAFAGVKTASAADLEELLRSVFGEDEVNLPWPVDDVRNDGAEHTATGNVAGGAGIALQEITISSDIDGVGVDQIDAVTDPSASRPVSRAHGRISANEEPDVTAPDGPLPRERTRRVLLASLGVGALAVLGVGAVMFGRRAPVATSSDAGVPTVVVNDIVDAAIPEVDAGEAEAIAFDEELPDTGVDAGVALRRPVVAKKKKGKLQVDTRPWTHVRVNGKRAGTTPVAIVLTVGKHRVTLENEESGIRREVDVVINSDEPTMLRLDLRK